MKNKNQNMEILRQDLIKYCKQFGVIDCKIPKLVFYGEEFKTDASAKTHIRHGLGSVVKGGRYSKY